MIREPSRRPRIAATASAIILLVGMLAACGGTPPRADPANAPPAATPAPSPPPAPQAAPAGTGNTAARAEPTDTPAPTITDENSIFFVAGATRVDPVGAAKLRRHAARLKENPRQDVTLVGHTDNLGSSSYNLAIAEQRAAAVARMLQSMGVSRSQIRHYGMGDEKTGPTCRTAACRQKKRRVDLIYSD